MALDAKISFAEWISYMFDHPVGDRRWHYDMDTDYWDGSPADVVAYLTRTFEECDAVLSAFSDAQIAQGLTYAIDAGGSGYAFALLETDVPLAARLRCIQAMETLFANCFVPRCSPRLSHLDMKMPEGVSPLNQTGILTTCRIRQQLGLIDKPIKHDISVAGSMNDPSKCVRYRCRTGAMNDPSIGPTARRPRGLNTSAPLCNV